MLPAQIPTARIMSFGYESQWYGDNAIKVDLQSVANDLLEDLHDARKVRWQGGPIYSRLTIYRAVQVAESCLLGIASAVWSFNRYLH